MTYDSNIDFTHDLLSGRCLAGTARLPHSVSAGQLPGTPPGIDQGGSKAGLESFEGLFAGLAGGWCWLFAGTVTGAVGWNAYLGIFAWPGLPYNMVAGFAG